MVGVPGPELFESVTASLGMRFPLASLRVTVTVAVEVPSAVTVAGGTLNVDWEALMGPGFTVPVAKTMLP